MVAGITRQIAFQKDDIQTHVRIKKKFFAIFQSSTSLLDV